MSLAAVPDDDELSIDGMWLAGRQLRAASGVPVAWVSDTALGSGLVWADLAEESAESGLQPFLLYGQVGGPYGRGRPASDSTSRSASRSTPRPSTGWMSPTC